MPQRRVKRGERGSKQERRCRVKRSDSKGGLIARKAAAALRSRRPAAASKSPENGKNAQQASRSRAEPDTPTPAYPHAVSRRELEVVCASEEGGSARLQQDEIGRKRDEPTNPPPPVTPGKSAKEKTNGSSLNPVSGPADVTAALMGVSD